MVSELPSASNKYLTPLTLVVSPPIHQTRPSGSDWASSLQGESELDSGAACSLSIVRVSEGDGVVSELPSVLNKYHTPTTCLVGSPSAIYQTMPSGSNFAVSARMSLLHAVNLYYVCRSLIKSFSPCLSVY